MAGGGGAAGAQGPVRRLARGPEAVRLDAGGVRTAVAGRGVAGQAFVVGHAPRAAAAGPGALVQLVHVQLEGIADVRLPVLLLLWNHKHVSVYYRLNNVFNYKLDS